MRKSILGTVIGIICVIGLFISQGVALDCRDGTPPDVSARPLVQWRASTWSQSAAAMSDVTRILSAIDQGDPAAAEQLLPLVYEELRRLAAQRLLRKKPNQTLQATALVHEAYLQLVGAQNAQH